MSTEVLIIEQSPSIQGTVTLEGAKNAVLVIIASLILTEGKSILRRVPASEDVYQMIALLQDCGAQVLFDEENKTLVVDTSTLSNWTVRRDIMRKMRASILVMGPLLTRFQKAVVALPGGCVIGPRPIDFHLKAFARMGVTLSVTEDFLDASYSSPLKAQTFVLEYPSVGATENILMAAVKTNGKTKIINAALEPEVLDLITVLKKMGANIEIQAPATICIEGVSHLNAIEHDIVLDRLEAGTLLLAAAISGGSICIPHAPAHILELFLEKLSEMGHSVEIGGQGEGITLKATAYPKAVSFKTMPYPGFPTDLQAPMMAALCLASGTSIIHETVYENRLNHVRELQKMGANIEVNGTTATITGVDELYGVSVIASDIRASAALVLAGIIAQGKTAVTGTHHIKRGYAGLDQKLIALGCSISYQTL